MRVKSNIPNVNFCAKWRAAAIFFGVTTPHRAAVVQANQASPSDWISTWPGYDTATNSGAKPC